VDKYEICGKVPSFNKVVSELMEAVVLTWSCSDAKRRPSFEKDFELLQRLERRWQEDDQIKGGIRDRWEQICTLAEKHKGSAQNWEDVARFIFDGVVRSKRLADSASESASERSRSKKGSRKAFAELGKVLARKISDAKTLAERARAFDVIANATRRLSDELGELSVLQVSNKTPRGMRSDKDGSRAVRVFCWRLGEGIYRATGRRFDGAVAIFAQVAFDRRNIDVDTVRKLRRPTTNKGRHSEERPILSS
jgi:hypothetical protein